MLSDVSVYQPTRYPRPTGDRKCVRCTRVGSYGFVLVDRYADGSRVWAVCGTGRLRTAGQEPSVG